VSCLFRFPFIQSLAKWCARMALGLSNSVPGIEIAAEHIMEIDDIC
jgi:RNA-dependent RNA polymerase